VRKLLPPRAHLSLQSIVRANGAGWCCTDDYAREYLIGAALARPTLKGLVHTRAGFERCRKETKRIIAAAARRQVIVSGRRPVMVTPNLTLDNLLKGMRYAG
jgi:hypothetical protein